MVDDTEKARTDGASGAPPPCASCGTALDDNASMSANGMVCQACALSARAAEETPDRVTDLLRRCPHCGRQTARLIGSTSHWRTVAGEPVVSQGSTFAYDCTECHRGFSLLSRGRRLWFVFGVVMGIVAGAFGVFVGDEGLLIAGAGAIALVTCLAILVYDARMRALSGRPASGDA